MPAVSGFLDISTAINVGGLTVWDEGWTENIVRLGTSSATRRLRCFASQRDQLYEYLMSGYVVQGGKVIQNLTAYPDLPWLYCDDIKAVPNPDDLGNFVGPNGMFAQTYAILDVIYKSYPYATGQQGYITFRYSQAVLALPTDASGVTGFTWGSDSTPIPSESAPPFHYQLCGITCHLLNQPPVAQSTISSLLDSVNSDTFFGFSAQCVKYIGCDVGLSSSGYNPSGAGFTEEQTWQFEARSFSWNKILRPSLMSGAANVLAALDTTNPPLYATTGYSSIFPLAAG